MGGAGVETVAEATAEVAAKIVEEAEETNKGPPIVFDAVRCGRGRKSGKSPPPDESLVPRPSVSPSHVQNGKLASHTNAEERK
jgi:hypothetical protein